ncbi:glycosyltransferase [Erwinia aphidicola]|uniref:glycosyltransferase n=1 Tax=Erwinia aphidicola TaxID=68334 RepID=UPI003CF9D527
MKKLHIINLEKMGGVERLFLQYINETSDDSNSVICISGKIGAEIKQQMPQQEVTFATRMINSWSLRCPQFLRKYLLQWKIFRADADVIIVWDLIPGLAEKPKRGKLLYYDHGCSWRYARNPKTLRFFSMLDGVISASYASKRVMQLRFNLPCPNQVVTNRVKPPENVSAMEKPASTTLRLGSASRLVTLKGISVSLQMMHELLRRGHDVTMEIAGKGPDKDAFVALAERLQLGDRITFSGFQQNVADFFNRIDVYISTPVTEPFGLSCMESLYYGVPVIYPMIDGQPEAVKDGICGLGITPTVTIEEHQQSTNILVEFPHKVYDPVSDALVQPKLLSPISCADAVEKFMDPVALKEISQNVRCYAADNFDYDSFKKEFDETLYSYVETK